MSGEKKIHNFEQVPSGLPVASRDDISIEKLLKIKLISL